MFVGGRSVEDGAGEPAAEGHCPNRVAHQAQRRDIRIPRASRWGKMFAHGRWRKLGTIARPGTGRNRAEIDVERGPFAVEEHEEDDGEPEAGAAQRASPPNLFGD